MKKILIAEDNDSNYLLMTYILKGHYEYVRARNGLEVVEMVGKESPDLVILDLKMPVLDGLEAARQIRAKFSTLPIIAVTANAFESDRLESIKAGCNEFLTKPVSCQVCLETIQKYI